MRRIWTRGEDSPFSKTTMLNDGEWSRFLWSAEGADEEAMIDKSYSGFAKLDEQRMSAIKAMALAYFVLALAYFEVLGDAKAGGLTLKPAYLDVVALFLASVVGVQFALIDAKYSYFQTLYTSLYDRAGAARRTELVAQFPAAFNVLQFSRPGRGYPKDIFPHSQWAALLFPILMLALIGLGLVGMAALSIMIGAGIWNSADVPVFIARGAVIMAILAALIVVIIPRQWPWRRRYVHYGMSSLLDRLGKTNPERHKLRHRQIAAARLRSGWVPEEEA